MLARHLVPSGAYTIDLLYFVVRIHGVTCHFVLCIAGYLFLFWSALNCSDFVSNLFCFCFVSFVRAFVRARVYMCVCAVYTACCNQGRDEGDGRGPVHSRGDAVHEASPEQHPRRNAAELHRAHQRHLRRSRHDPLRTAVSLLCFCFVFRLGCAGCALYCAVPCCAVFCCAVAAPL